MTEETRMMETRMTEETIKNKYNLLLCELHHPGIHGKTNNSAANIETHFLIHDRFDGHGYPIKNQDEDTEEEDTEDETDEDEDVADYNITSVMEFLKNQYSDPANFNLRYFESHPTIRNYRNIINNSNYIKPEIGEYIVLPTQEAVAILKTFWLRILQRKWKNVFKERLNIMKMRSNPICVYARQITGKWPPYCSHLPGLTGMLNPLKKYNANSCE
jgi:hypothetical protein